MKSARLRWLKWLFVAAVIAAAAGFVFLRPSAARGPSSRVEILEIEGKTLRGNPLGDPIKRRVAIYVPNGVPADQPLPIVYYLTGYGSSCEDVIPLGENSPFAPLVQQLADAGLPLIIVVTDGRNRWGGSQFLNSPAQGNYADYIADEIVEAVEAKHPLKGGRAGRVIAGHSSGGYGALMMAMSRQKEFGAVVALSPDSDFEVTHKDLVQKWAVRRLTPLDIEDFCGPAATARRPPASAEIVLGLSAAYAAKGPAQPGRINWLYDADGKWQPQVWQQWLDLDPLLIVRKKKDAFAADQRIYLDGSSHDEWGFNISARKVYDELKARGAKVTFDEPPGAHSDHIIERLARGLAWVFEQPLPAAR